MCLPRERTTIIRPQTPQLARQRNIQSQLQVTVSGEPIQNRFNVALGLEIVLVPLIEEKTEVKPDLRIVGPLLFQAGQFRGLSVMITSRIGAGSSSLLRVLSKMLVTSPFWASLML